MSNVWERFDGIASAEEVTEAKTQFAPIDAGDYEMVLEELKPAESADGLPMIKGKFRTVEGNKVVFYNQMLQNLNYPNMTAVNIAEAVTFVGGLIGEDIEFTGLTKFAETVESVTVGETYTINVSYGKKDTEKKFAKLKFVKTIELPF